MAQLPIQHTPTIELLYKGYADRAKDFRRPHLGASVIGKECPRALWMDFRWASDPRFESRILRLFESGYKEEDRIYYGGNNAIIVMRMCRYKYS